VQRNLTRWASRRTPDMCALVDFGAAIVDAIADHWPAVVLALLDDIHLVAAAWTVLVLPQFAACGIKREALRVAMIVAPDFRFGALPADKWVIRYRSVGTQANDLAGWLARFCAWSATYSPNVRNRLSSAAEKIVLGERAFLTKDDLQIIQPRRCIGAQSGTRKGGTGAADRGLDRLFGGPRTVERTWTWHTSSCWICRKPCAKLVEVARSCSMFSAFGPRPGRDGCIELSLSRSGRGRRPDDGTGSNTQARFRKPQGRWIASYTQIAWGVGLSHERSDVAGAVDSVEMIPGYPAA
jgi:hypothetical protein